MATGQTATDLRPDWVEDDGISESTAEKHNEALDLVQRLLAARGVRSFAVRTIRLKLSSERPSRRLQTRLGPELVVPGGDGQPVAMVNVGARSGCYLVTLRGDRPGMHTVNQQSPQRAADLILAADA
ncbi:hypothetical protein [Sphaerisporangium corydalis]|uniref:Uncharacterized protein n=1 Tax=Sphaerisporangium corydalis TaxID=1441875 RepID=A0ABV9ENT7_9ACTN|nr:hypothetical protein [Sphaerisporangium corydalis]